MLGSPHKTDLKSVSDFNSTWADRVAYLILVGLLVDIADLFIPEGWWKIAVAIGANLLIFGGVWGELLFAKRAREADDGRVAEANAIAALAQKEAAEARERTAEIERITAWRHISPEQAAQIADALRSRAAILDVLIEHERGDSEAYSYARELAKVFSDSGVKPNNIRGTPNSYFGVVWGLLGKASKPVDASFIKETFANAGIAVWMISEDLSAHLPRNERPPNLYIFVAPKPPPEYASFASVNSANANDITPQSANERAAVVDNRAATIERAAAPRRITAEQRDAIIRALREKLPLTHDQISRGKTTRNEDDQLLLDLWIACFDDPEARQFSSDLIETFKLARAGNAARSILEPRLGDLPVGLYVLSSAQADLIRQIFSDAGVPVERNSEFEDRFSSDHARSGLVRLYIGHKPSNRAPMDSSI